MDYLNNSVRKLSGFFSSPNTANASAEHKTDHIGSLDSEESDGGHDRYYDRSPPQPPQPPQKRRYAVTEREKILLNADEAVRKARSAMRTGNTLRATKSVEFNIQEELSIQEELGKEHGSDQEIHIQDELERQLRQEENDAKKRNSQPSSAKVNNAPAADPQATEQVATNSRTRSVRRTSRSKATKAKESQLWKDLSPHQQWTTNPNRRAREVLYTSNGIADTLGNLQEPAYACRDIEIRDGLQQLINQIRTLAAEHFSVDVDAEQSPLRRMVMSLKAETVKIIGCVASGGPAGAKGWEALILEKDKRQALVCAIIGNVLVEQVFQHLFFGGTEEQIKEVCALQFKHRHDDGFDRTALYARKIRGFLTLSSGKYQPLTNDSYFPLSLPKNFNTHLAHTISALSTHLAPFFLLHQPSYEPPPITFLSTLHALTTHAALLSLSMRLHPDTAYHFAPCFKNENFLADEMQCFNHAAVLATHPRGEEEEDGICTVEMARREGLSEAERDRMKGDEPIVQISIFPGVVAYRRGGFESPLFSLPSATSTTATSSPPEMLREGGAKGFRSRRLLEGLVYCRWGRKRVWVDGKPADDPEVHGEQWDGGFVEFYPGIKGVVDPKGGQGRE